MEQERLSELYEQYKDLFADKYQLSELVHDSLAVDNYPDFTSWYREYGEGRSIETCRAIFVDMKLSRRKLKQLVGDQYECFIYSHRDI